MRFGSEKKKKKSCVNHISTYVRERNLHKEILLLHHSFLLLQDAIEVVPRISDSIRIPCSFCLKQENT